MNNIDSSSSAPSDDAWRHILIIHPCVLRFTFTLGLLNSLLQGVFRRRPAGIDNMIRQFEEEAWVQSSMLLLTAVSLARWVGAGAEKVAC